MVATNQDLRNFFALAGINVTMSQLGRARDWLQTAEGFEGPPDADDLIRTIHKYLRQRVLAFEDELAEQAIIKATW